MPKLKINKQDTAYEKIKARLENGELIPGQRLVIDALAREFKISPVPIREAIRRLEAEGWVLYQPNTGPEVARLSRKDWENTVELMAVMESYAIATAAPLLRKDQIQTLKGINRTMKSALDKFDVAEFHRCNRLFVDVFHEHCPNGYIVENLKSTRRRLTSLSQAVFHTEGAILTIVGRQVGWSTLEAHKKIVELVETDADAETIERVWRSDIFTMLRQTVEYLKKKS